MLVFQKLKTILYKHKLLATGSLIICIAFYLMLPKRLFNAPTSFVLLDSSGNVLSASIAADGQWRFPFNKNIPEKFEKCITTFEDKRFFYHFGIDPIALGRAIYNNVKLKKITSGGSTISMQVARLYKQNSKRNLINKCLETMLAIRLECSFRKKSILALYASNAPFGGNVVGLEAASWRYYGRSANELSWGETAALAVLPNAPALVHPGKNSAILLKKRNDLIDKLLQEKIIDSTTAMLAKVEPLPSKPKPLPELVPHLLNRFKKDYLKLNDENSESTLAKTTISKQLQIQVNNIAEQHIQLLKGNQINNIAIMVVDVNKGNILAYLGNIFASNTNNYEQYVDVLSSVRSPGSTLKPILYAAALTDGNLLPKQLIFDIPTNIGGYTPQNYDLTFDGAVPADEAISRSLNIPSVRILQQYKYQRFYSLLKQMGISSLKKTADFYGMSLILGGCEINPFELAGVYSSLARVYNNQKINKGKWFQDDWKMPQYQSHETNHHKEITPLLNYASIWHMFNTMNEVMRPGEEGLWNSFTSAQKIAWKTGTSFGNRDAWAIGLTPNFCTVVWVGNTSGEGRPSLTGIQTAAPILFDVFRLLPHNNWFQNPAYGYQFSSTCKKSGFKSSSNCSEIDTIMVADVTEKAAICPYCKKISVDKLEKFRVNSLCEIVYNIKQKTWFVLPPIVEYYYKQKNSSYISLPPLKQGCVADITKVIDIIYPEQNAKIYIPIEANGKKGSSIFSATNKNKNGTLFWHLDEIYLGSTNIYHQMAVNPTVGKHILKIIDTDGNTCIQQFEILDKVQ